MCGTDDAGVSGSSSGDSLRNFLLNLFIWQILVALKVKTKTVLSFVEKLCSVC